MVQWKVLLLNILHKWKSIHNSFTHTCQKTKFFSDTYKYVCILDFRLECKLYFSFTCIEWIKCFMWGSEIDNYYMTSKYTSSKLGPDCIYFIYYYTHICMHVVCVKFVLYRDILLLNNLYLIVYNWVWYNCCMLLLIYIIINLMTSTDAFYGGKFTLNKDSVTSIFADVFLMLNF